MSSLRPSKKALLFLISLVTAQNQCYYAANKRAGSAIIPCGRSGTNSACCQIGDLCLSDSACWNPQYNVTYLYGCTDSTYQDATCPWKCGNGYASAPYVGLEYCSNTTTNEWSCTHPPSNADNIQPNPPQLCVDDSIIAFAGPSSLQPILSLPTNVGGGTVWFTQVNPTSYSLDPGYTPTTTIAVIASVPSSVEQVSPSTSRTPSSTTTTSSSLTPTSPSTTSAPPTSSPPISPTSSSQSPISASNAAASASNSASPTSSASSSSSGLSTGAKIGIGVGVGLAALIALGLLAAFLLRRRRSNRDSYRHTAVSQIDRDTHGTDYGATIDKEYGSINRHRRGPSELEGSAPNHGAGDVGGGRYRGADATGGGGTGYGTGTGTGTGTGMSGGYGGVGGAHDSSTGSNWGTPAPTYSPRFSHGTGGGPHELG